MTNPTTHSLQGQFLVAMPNLADSFFERKLIYLIEHNEKGAMGLVINQALDVRVDDILEQFGEPDRQSHHPDKILAGGPVEANRGFIVHRTQEAQWLGETAMDDGISVTSSADILEALAQGQNIGPYLLILGYAGWDAGQLEQEILDNAWLVIPANPEVFFNIELEHRLDASLHSLGINYSQLSHGAGRA